MNNLSNDTACSTKKCAAQKAHLRSKCTEKSKDDCLNSIKLTGTIIGEPAFSHEITRKDKADESNISFLRFTIEIKRFSGVSDFLQVVVSKNTWDKFINHRGYILDKTNKKVLVEVSGRLQSYNRIDPELGEAGLELFVYANNIRYLTTDTKENDSENITAFTRSNKSENINTVSLEGFVCKKPILRHTHSGRTIADLFIAVNYRGKSSYIPVILWSGNAVNARTFKVGDKVRLTGRFQSREFAKIINGTLAARTAYEMSASKVKLLDGVPFVHC